MPPAEAVPSGAYAALPGVRLWFVDTGGAGVPIVLLHPNTGTVEIWEPQISAFARAGYRVIAFDRRGWGKSTPDPAAGSAARQHRRRSRMRSRIISSSTNFICSASLAVASLRWTMRPGIRSGCGA